MKRKPETYPRIIGVILAFFLPGSAHWLSGHRKAGLYWYLSIWAFVLTGTLLEAVPNKAVITAGLVFIALSATLLPLIILIRSFRPVQRLKAKGWIMFILAVLAANLIKLPVRHLLPMRPYKIPAGSMEPTLHGTTAREGEQPRTFLSQLTHACSHEQYQALASGSVSDIRMTGNTIYFNIGSTPHQLPALLMGQGFRPKQRYSEGDTIWSGNMYEGDHISINRMAYAFNKPRRGDIVVFKTAGIAHQAIRQDTVYVKRIVGLPNEIISITPSGNVQADGAEITEPAILSELNFTHAGELSTAEDSIKLSSDEYFVFGDNQSPNMSLDSRFYGAIDGDSIIGKVSTIYWPLSRIGPVE